MLRRSEGCLAQVKLGYPPPDTSSMRISDCMAKHFNDQQTLAGEIGMDTQTVFHANGDINIYPCAWEDEQVTDGGCQHHKGRMTVEEDGTSFFHAYRSNSGSRYLRLYETANGEVKRTRTNLIVKLTLPLGIGRSRIIEALTSQVEEIKNYIRSLKENTVWK